MCSFVAHNCILVFLKIRLQRINLCCSLLDIRKYRCLLIQNLGIREVISGNLIANCLYTVCLQLSNLCCTCIRILGCISSLYESTLIKSVESIVSIVKLSLCGIRFLSLVSLALSVFNTTTPILLFRVSDFKSFVIIISLIHLTSNLAEFEQPFLLDVRVVGLDVVGSSIQLNAKFINHSLLGSNHRIFLLL